MVDSEVQNWRLTAQEEEWGWDVHRIIRANKLGLENVEVCWERNSLALTKECLGDSSAHGGVWLRILFLTFVFRIPQEEPSVPNHILEASKETEVESLAAPA